MPLPREDTTRRSQKYSSPLSCEPEKLGLKDDGINCDGKAVYPNMTYATTIIPLRQVDIHTGG